MKTEHAIRYLLLRNLKAFERAVPAEQLIEVMTSLSVVPEGRGHRLRWRRGGHQQQRELSPDTFDLYRRGDRPPQLSRGEEHPLANDAVAREVAAAMLGVDTAAADRPQPYETLEPLRWWSASEIGLLAGGLWYAGGLQLSAALALVAFGVAEFGTRGRIYASWLLLLLVVCSPPGAALLAAMTWALLQFLDPDARWRLMRVSAGALAGAIAGARLGFLALPTLSFTQAMLIGPVAFCLVVVRGLHGVHFRAVPLVLPIYCLGLSADGLADAAWIGTGTLALSTTARLALRTVLPVQRQHELTPYG